MIDGLAIAIIVVSLVVAAWAFVNTSRDVAPNRTLYIGMGVVGAITTVQVLIVVVRLLLGHGPQTAEQVVTLAGYLLTTVLVPPTGVVLARMEPTKYGSALVGAACLVLAVLVLRLQQLWWVPGG